MRLKIYLICIYLLFNSVESYSQYEGFLNNLSEQDSTKISKNKLWIDFSFGPSFTSQPDGLTLFVIGPSFDFTYINSKYQLIKIKSSYHLGLAIFENYPQYSRELDLMSGKINVVSPNHTTEFYYGIGLIQGRKRVSIISSTDGGDGPGISVRLPWTDYEKKDFITIGFPFEYKIQWSIFGLGIDGNLNPYLPYLGTKWYIKIGNKYKK
jgi:hypothetical protein